MKRHHPLVIVSACIVAALAGCGGSASSRAEAHLAAVANAACIKSEGLGEHPGFLSSDLAKLRALIYADRKLPRVSTFLSDSAAQRRVQAAMRKLSKKAGNGAFFSAETDRRVGLQTGTRPARVVKRGQLASCLAGFKAWRCQHHEQLDEIFEALRQLISPPPAAQASGRLQVAQKRQVGVDQRP